MLAPFRRSLKCSKRSVILTRSLPDSGTYHNFENLVFAKAGRLHGTDVLVSDLVSVLYDFVD
jgi:hypothetical protein